MVYMWKPWFSSNAFCNSRLNFYFELSEDILGEVYKGQDDLDYCEPVIDRQKTRESCLIRVGFCLKEKGIWPSRSSTLLSPPSLPRERWDPGPAKPLIGLFPAPSLTQPPPTICHLPWVPLIWLEGKGIGFIKNCWHLKLASTALGCQLSRGRKNSLGLISGPNKASHGF